MSNAIAFAALPLRQRKFARTKLGLLEAALAALETRSLDEITVNELCDQVGISPASFFNYFPKKSDLLVYYIQLWSLEMGWHSAQRAPASGGLHAIEDIFALTAREVARRPGPMGEIIAGQARSTETPAFQETTRAERLLAHPGLAGIEEVQAQGLDELLPPLVAQAIAGGELPDGTDREAVFLALASIFFGVPVVLRRMEPGLVEIVYRTQLRVLWAGLRAGSEQEAS